MCTIILWLSNVSGRIGPAVLVIKETCAVGGRISDKVALSFECHTDLTQREKLPKQGKNGFWEVFRKGTD